MLCHVDYASKISSRASRIQQFSEGLSGCKGLGKVTWVMKWTWGVMGDLGLAVVIKRPGLAGEGVLIVYHFGQSKQ